MTLFMHKGNYVTVLFLSGHSGGVKRNYPPVLLNQLHVVKSCADKCAANTPLLFSVMIQKKKNPQQYYQSKVGHNVPAQKGSGLAINFLWQLSWCLQAVLVYTLNCRNLMKWLTTIFLSKKYFSSLKHMVLSFKNLKIHGINN